MESQIVISAVVLVAVAGKAQRYSPIPGLRIAGVAQPSAAQPSAAQKVEQLICKTSERGYGCQQLEEK